MDLTFTTNFVTVVIIFSRDCDNFTDAVGNCCESLGSRMSSCFRRIRRIPTMFTSSQSRDLPSFNTQRTVRHACIAFSWCLMLYCI